MNHGCWNKPLNCRQKKRMCCVFVSILTYNVSRAKRSDVSGVQLSFMYVDPFFPERRYWIQFCFQNKWVFLQLALHLMQDQEIKLHKGRRLRCSTLTNTTMEGCGCNQEKPILGGFNCISSSCSELWISLIFPAFPIIIEFFFSGDYCEVNLCHNGGTCVTGVGDDPFICICADGFGGDTCNLTETGTL